MSIKDEVRKAAQKFVVQAELNSYERAKVGMINGDGSVTIVVPKRTDFIYVTKADSTVTIALNRGTVPLQYGLPIKMRVEAGVYVVQGRDRVMEAPGTGTDNPYGVNPHNLDTHTDVTITTPVDNQFLRYNGTAWVNETVTAGAVDSVNGQTGAVVLDTDDIAEGATNLWFTSAEETKLAGIAAGAEVNVNADWSAVSGDAQILNKPAIPATFDDLTDGTTNKAYTSTEKTKLAGIEALADVTDQDNVGAAIHGATAKTTPVDADTMPLIDSAASNVLKKVTWANIKATLKTYFDTLYTAISTAVLLTGDQSVAGVKTFSSVPIVPGIDGATDLILRTGSAAGSDFVMRAEDALFFQNRTGLTTYMYLSSAGAGIGTTAPSARLDVSGTMRATSFNNPTSGVGLEFRYNTGGGNGSILAFDRDASARVPLDFDASKFSFTTGDVGMGTTSPQGKLHAHDGTGGMLFVSKTGIVGSAQTIIPDGTGDVTKRAMFIGIASSSLPEANMIQVTVAPGANVDTTYSGGVLRFTVSAGGALTVIRQSGASTFSISGIVIWQ